jgi:hypothetical protein
LSEWLGLLLQSMFPLSIAIPLRYISIAIGASRKSILIFAIFENQFLVFDYVTNLSSLKI